jgi:excisionase family DNA binding protein
VTARERLAGVLAPDVLAALEELVAERVAAELEAATADGARSPWLSIRDAAERAGVAERTLERAIAAGRLRSSTVGRRRLVHRDHLDAYVRGDGGGEAPATPPRRRRGV